MSTQPKPAAAKPQAKSAPAKAQGSQPQQPQQPGQAHTKAADQQAIHQPAWHLAEMLPGPS